MKTWRQFLFKAKAQYIAPLLAAFFICFVLLVVQPIAAQERCTPADGEPIILGAIFPEGNLLTRRDAESYQGAEAMRQAVNACGGVDGRPVEFMYEPANDRDDAAEAAQRLVDAGVPLIVGSGSQAVSEGAREVTEAAGVVYWEMTEPWDETGYGAWIFSSRPSNHALGERAVSFALQMSQDSLGLSDPRIALVYEDRPRGQQIATGVQAGLRNHDVDLALEYSYSDILYDTSELGERIRDELIDILILSVFDEDGEYLWYALREADANVDAWIQVGGEGYNREWCERGGNMQGFISIDATGPVSDNYRREVIGEVYDQYRSIYLNEYGAQPSSNADLSANGVYFLWRYILPFVEGEYSPQSVRVAMLATIDDPFSPNAPHQAVGIMGPSDIHPLYGDIVASSVIVRQQQGSFFCSVWPEDIATCAAGVQPFPTWRERALMEQNPAICTGDGI